MILASELSPDAVIDGANGSAITFVVLGAVFLLGLAADTLGRRTHLPRVTTLLILGFIVGPAGLALLHEGHSNLFERASEIALTMVGFLLGERLVHSLSNGEGRPVLLISVAAVAVTAAIVFVGLWLIGLGTAEAMLLAGIATATAPAATIDVVRQSGAKGKFVDMLLGVVAIDDAWGLLGFSLLMAAARIAIGDGGAWAPIGDGLWEIGGALVIGGVLGFVMAALTGRIEKGEPTLLEAIGFVLLAVGFALWIGVSFILTAMIMGAVVARFAKHHERPFHAIENVELPFMILFFMLAGASLDIAALGQIGWFGLAYIVLRISGRIIGGWWGARLSGASPDVGRHIGFALMPQAGVALGMALFAAQKFPEIGVTVMQIAIGSTVVFELFGPLLTRSVLKRTGQIASD
ncbi:MAG: Kef-type K+ transport system membrane component KefB [Verrucomicrobiales bacterium]|jgi:Kef-type K+ transport system membrane component KefB